MERATASTTRPGRELAKRLAAIADAAGEVIVRHGDDGTTVRVRHEDGTEERTHIPAGTAAGAADVQLRRLAFEARERRHAT